MGGMPAELDCRRLVVGYGDHRVLDQVSFSLRPGVTVLLGTNGAGKTTLLRTLAGGLTPLGGQVELDQEPVEAADLTHSVAYAAQATEVVGWLNVREYLTYAGYAAGHSWKSASARGDLMSAACNLSQLLQVRTDKLSGGQQRRLCLAAASMGDAKVFLLDEPTAGLDPVQRADIVGLLATWRSRTVLVSTHAVADVMDLADRLILIRHGPRGSTTR